MIAPTPRRVIRRHQSPNPTPSATDAAEPATQPDGNGSTAGATAGADGFTDWFDREFEGDLAPDRESPDRDPNLDVAPDVALTPPPVDLPPPIDEPPARVGTDPLGRAVRRIFRRPTEWATSDWPTRRIVQVVFTVFSLAVTTAIMMNVVHLNPLSSSPRPRVRRHHADGR